MSRRRPPHPAFRKIWKIVQVVAVLAAAVGGGVLAYDYFRQQQYLVVKNVVVKGNQRVSTEELLDYAQVPMGAPLYQAQTDAFEKSLLLHPDIQAAKVRRVPPDTLVLEVVEHVPVATVVAASGVYLVNTQGRLFRRTQAGELLDLPVMTGVDPKLFQNDLPRAQKLVSDAVEVLRVWELAGQDLKDLNELEMHEDFGATLRVGTLPTEVALGRGKLEDKLARYAAIQKHLHKQDQQLEKIFLDNTRHPERVALLVHQPVNNSRP